MATSPYVVNVATLLGRPGAMEELTLEFAVPERIGEGMLYLDAGTQLTIELRIEILVDGVLATAQCASTLVGECSRCLQPLKQEWSGQITELFGLDEQDESLDYFVRNDEIDLEGPLRDTLVLELPFQPLCKEDCLGLNPNDGTPLVEPLPEAEAEVDPRWAKLQELLGSDALVDDSREK